MSVQQMRSIVAITIISLFVCYPIVANAADSAGAEGRSLLKIPFKDREDILRVMRGNLASLGEMIEAMAEDDYKAVEEIADRMAFNKKKSKGLARRGDQAFAAMGVQFHAVDVIEVKKAAGAKDRKATLRAMSTMVSTCVACHSTFKLVEWPDNKTYKRPEPVPLDLPPNVKIRD